MEDTQVAPIVSAGLPAASKLLSKAISFLGNNFIKVVLIFAMPFVIVSAGTLLSEATSTALLSLSLVLTLIGAVASYFAFLTFVYFLKTNGQVSLRGAFSYTFRTIWVFILNFSVIFEIIFSIIVIAFGAYITGLFDLAPWLPLVLTIFFFIIFFVLFFLFAVLFLFSYYACVLDDKRGLEASAFSWYYVWGSELKVVWRLIFLGFVNLLVILLLGFILSTFGYEGGNQSVFNVQEDCDARVTETPFGFGDQLAQTKCKKPSQSPVFVIVFSAFQHFVFTPISLLYSYLLYSALKTGKAPPVDAELSRLRKRLKKLVILGPIAFVILFIILVAWGLTTFLPAIRGIYETPSAAVSPLAASLVPFLVLWR